MKRSVFNKALDSFNEYMANQGCYLFDPPVQEFSSEEEGYVFLGNRNSSFGRYEIETVKTRAPNKRTGRQAAGPFTYDKDYFPITGICIFASSQSLTVTVISEDVTSM